MPDSIYQLAQAYGYIKYNNHHPILHTLILGNLVKLGEYIFNSQNLGLFAYTVLQYLLTTSSLALSIKNLAEKVNYKYCLFLLLIYSFIPLFPLYAVTVTKDSVFAPLFLLWFMDYLNIIGMLEKTSKNVNKSYWIKLFILSLLVCMFRKTGIYVVTGALVIVIIIYCKRLWKNNKRLFTDILLILISVFTIFTGFNSILPIFNIKNGSIREMLSIPFQQTARYVYVYPNEVTEKERAVISKVLDYDVLATDYNPTLSDPVKGTFNETATSLELRDYFKTWLTMFLKHPTTYISAVLNNYWQWFFTPYASEGGFYWTTTESKSTTLEKYMLNISLYEDSQIINGIRNFINIIYKLIFKIPVISLLMTSAFYQWVIIIFIGYFIIKKQYKLIVAFLPVIITLISILIGPCNGTHFRYEYPIAFSIFYLIVWCFYFMTKEKNG